MKINTDVSESIHAITSLQDKLASRIMDRTQAIDKDLVDQVVARGVMNWEGRMPTPALDRSGNLIASDLDLLSFLVPLAQRGAVIEIPEYTSRRQVVQREGVRRVSGAPRFGRVNALISNKDVFSFSVELFDNTIITTDPSTGQESIGDFRRFMLVDVDGHWYDGWSSIQFKPNAPENKFLRQWGIIDESGRVPFKWWVHPNRWQSIFGAAHLLKKLLYNRLDDEAKYYRAERKQLEGRGLALPSKALKEWPEVTNKGDTAPIQVQTIESLLDHPSFVGSYSVLPDTQDGLVTAYERNKLITYVWKPFVQFGIRANEAAYAFHGGGMIAPWLKGCEWQSFQESPRHAQWQRLVLSDGFALRLRRKTVTERVAVE